MEQPPRYSTLYDYLRVIRRRWMLIVAFTVALGAAALALSLAQEPTYEASAQIEFRDVATDLNLIAGTSPIPDIGAGARAATNAELITRPEVTRRVAARLDTDLSLAELSASISTRVGIQTNLVILTATSVAAALAADIANAYAKVVKNVGTREALKLLSKLEESAARELREADNGKNADSFRLGSLQDRLSRIRTLRDVTEPVEIAVSAFEPTEPVAPKPARNTVLGLLLGLTFGVLAAFVRDSLDRRLHGAHEAQQELGVPVLGRVSERALMYPGLVEDGSPAINEADFEAFRILRTNLQALTNGEPRLKTILVTSGRPDEGKTAVSLSLASAFAIAGQRVLLVECDLRRPSFARRLAVNNAPGLTDYLMGAVEPKDVLQVVRLTEPSRTANVHNGGRVARGAPRNIVCITAGSPAAMPAELLGGERFHDFLEKVAKAYDTVVIDASPLLAVGDPLDLVSQVDGVLMCVRSGQTTRDEARAARAALAHLPDRPVGAVLTGLKRGGVDGYGYYYGY